MTPVKAPTAVPFTRGSFVTVEGMPNYGRLFVVSVKWSFVSGWWLDLRDDDGGTWSVHSSSAAAA